MPFRNPYAAYQKQAQLMKNTKKQANQPKAHPDAANTQQANQPKQPVQPQSISQQMASQYQEPIESQQSNNQQTVKQPEQPSQAPTISQSKDVPYQKPVESQQNNVQRPAGQSDQQGQQPKVRQQSISQSRPTRQPQQPGNDYLTNAIMTATPEELTLFLYRGAIKFMKQTIMQMEANNISEANRLNQRAQSIFRELMCGLDMDQEISHQLFNLYQFIIDSLVEANIKKNPELVSQMIEFTTELGSTWQEAMKLAKQQKAAGAGT